MNRRLSHRKGHVTHSTAGEFGDVGKRNSEPTMDLSERPEGEKCPAEERAVEKEDWEGQREEGKEVDETSSWGDR